MVHRFCSIMGVLVADWDSGLPHGSGEHDKTLAEHDMPCSVELGSGANRTVDLKLVGSVRKRLHTKQSSPWSQSSYSSSPSRPSSASSSFSSSSPLSRTFGSYMLEIAQRQLLHIIVFPLCLMPKRQRTLAAEQPGVATIKFRSSENYMSGLCWQVIRSDVAVDNSKLFCMASHMTKLGMTAQSLDETSIAEAVCLALFQSPDASLYDATRTLKKQMKLQQQQAFRYEFFFLSF